MKISIIPLAESDKSKRISPTVIIESTPQEWLEQKIHEALMDLLADPCPLVAGADGELHYVDPEEPNP